MSSRIEFTCIGEVEFSGSNVSFFGEVYVYYDTVDDWSMKAFHGILTNHGDRYRGKWTQGPQFEELKRLFLADPRLVEVTKECIKRSLNIYGEGHDA